MLSARIGRCKFTSRYVYEINGQLPSVVYVSRIYFPLMFCTHVLPEHKSKINGLPVVNFSLGFSYLWEITQPTRQINRVDIISQLWEISIVSIPTIYRFYIPTQPKFRPTYISRKYFLYQLLYISKESLKIPLKIPPNMYLNMFQRIFKEYSNSFQRVFKEYLKSNI